MNNAIKTCTHCQFNEDVSRLLQTRAARILVMELLEQSSSVCNQRSIIETPDYTIKTKVV
jgi:hypothetical protein